MKKEHNIEPEDFFCHDCEDDLVGEEGRDWHISQDPYGWTAPVYYCDSCASDAYDRHMEIYYS